MDLPPPQRSVSAQAVSGYLNNLEKNQRSDQATEEYGKADAGDENDEQEFGSRQIPIFICVGFVLGLRLTLQAVACVDGIGVDDLGHDLSLS